VTPPIYLYNTPKRAKVELVTEHPDRVTLYVCGPTVYNYAHIGNARPAVVFDILARLLRYDYAAVSYARNLTDVDDKINTAAAEAGVDINEITNRFIAAYHDDMRALGVLPPDLEPRVTEHIPNIVQLIETLIERKHAYVEQGHVLFHVPSYPEYGQLSARRTEDMLAGARVEVAPYKRDPMDFVLWKPSTPEQPGWDSPWGRGRPGWHVECTAMISKHLGPTIDIHGGGQDLIFPHHENEIAQGTCAHNTLYCRHWVHNSFVTVNGQKMSKSLGNVVLLRDLLEQAPAEAIRLALLSTHYRRPLDWNDLRLEQSKQTLVRLYTSLASCADIELTPNVPPDEQVLDALRNDLNVSEVLVRLRALADKLHDAETEEEKATIKSSLRVSASLIGLLEQDPQTALRCLGGRAESYVTDLQEVDEHIQALVRARQQARDARDYSRADALRVELDSLGYAVEGKADGVVLQRSQGASE